MVIWFDHYWYACKLQSNGGTWRGVNEIHVKAIPVLNARGSGTPDYGKEKIMAFGAWTIEQVSFGLQMIGHLL